MDVNEKIKGGAVWETIDDCDQLSSPETTTSQVHTAASPLLSKSYCYRCLKEIPGSSKYCPWCQIELLVKCPKCGNEYSAQYPACNQCGTNRVSYCRDQEVRRQQHLEEQKKEEERERKEREQKRLDAYEKKKDNTATLLAVLWNIIVWGVGLYLIFGDRIRDWLSK